MNKRLVLILVLTLGLSTMIRPQTQSEAADRKIQKTIKAFGGQAFLTWKDFYGEGRMYILRTSGQSWTKFWEYYKWSGKSRVNLDKKENALADIYNLDEGKGWSYEYGKVKDKTPAEVRDFRLGEKRNLSNLFRDRWKEPGVKVFYYGPNDIDSLKPLEALEFIDVENYSVTVYYEEGNPVPFKLTYKERNPDGIVLEKSEQFFRWFKYNGILTPLRVEYYTNDTEAGLLEYSLVQYNVGMPDSLFEKPQPEPGK